MAGIILQKVKYFFVLELPLSTEPLLVNLGPVGTSGNP